MERYLCAVAADDRGEPLFATASRVDRWLCVEQQGPWGPATLPQSRLDTAVAAALLARARQAGARLLLIRRPGGAVSPRRHVVVADSHPGRERVLVRTVADDAELLDLALPFVAEPAGWHSPSGPVFLVCTHGRHDPCCAMRGRPLAVALATRFPETTWECSHTGGDRFAGNVVVLPAGLYLGRVPPLEAVDVAEAVTAGRLPLAYFRGRSSYSTVVQAAQHFARAELQLDRIDDLAPRGTARVERDVWRVVLAAAPADVAVTVRRTVGHEPSRLTCHAADLRDHPAYVLVDLQPDGASAAG